MTTGGQAATIVWILFLFEHICVNVLRASSPNDFSGVLLNQTILGRERQMQWWGKLLPHSCALGRFITVFLLTALAISIVR